MTRLNGPARSKWAKIFREKEAMSAVGNETGPAKIEGAELAEPIHVA